MILFGVTVFALLLSGSAVIESTEAEELLCMDLLDPTGEGFSPSVSLMRGFVLGANAADLSLVDNDGWKAFAAELFAACTANPEKPLTGTIHDVFFNVMK